MGGGVLVLPRVYGKRRKEGRSFHRADGAERKQHGRPRIFLRFLVQRQDERLCIFRLFQFAHQPCGVLANLWIIILKRRKQRGGKRVRFKQLFPVFLLLGRPDEKRARGTVMFVDKKRARGVKCRVCVLKKLFCAVWLRQYAPCLILCHHGFSIPSGLPRPGSPRALSRCRPRGGALFMASI